MLVLLTTAFAGSGLAQATPKDARKVPALSRLNAPAAVVERAPAEEVEPAPKGAEAPAPAPTDMTRTLQSAVLFGAASLAPVALLMITPFVRINIVLILLRQALGSPQVPGNQVLMALALLLSALVMRPVAERVYAEAVEPYMAGKAGPVEAWNAGSRPIKKFMVDQIVMTNHGEYLTTLHDRARGGPPARPSRKPPRTSRSAWSPPRTSSAS